MDLSHSKSSHFSLLTSIYKAGQGDTIYLFCFKETEIRKAGGLCLNQPRCTLADEVAQAIATWDIVKV